MSITWERIGRGPLTGADWKYWLAQERSVDPYLIWAELCSLANFSLPGKSSSDPWPVLVELTENASLTLPGSVDQPASAEKCHPVMGLLDIPGIYRRRGEVPPKAPELKRRIFTALVPPACAAELLRHPDHIKRFQLGVPRIPSVERRFHPEEQPGSGDGNRIAVGVIDHGFAFAHTQFLNGGLAGGTPRTCYLWDQGRTAGVSTCSTQGSPIRWREVEQIGYGAELWHADLVEAMAHAPDFAPASPAAPFAPYQAVDYVPRRSELTRVTTHAHEPYLHALPICAPVSTMQASTHGTSVAALAAGFVPALASWCPVEGQVPALTDERDAANAWPLIFVQLPERTSLDSSGGSLANHVLDGIYYIINRARTIPAAESSAVWPPLFELTQSPSVPPRRQADGTAKPFANHVVICVSYGAIAGPHDGTSMLETAIRDLTASPDKSSEVRVVVAAGNAHGSKTHARLELGEGGPKKRLTWSIGADNLLESYLEVWLPDCDADGNALHPAWLSSLTVDLIPPAGLPPLRVGCGAGWLLHDKDSPLASTPMASAIFARQVAQGTRGTMMLLTVARTKRVDDGFPANPSPAVAPHGDWVVELKFGAAVAAQTRRRIVLHAWAERNDQLWGTQRRQQSTVMSDDPVPDPTEFSPTVIEFCRRSPLTAFTDEVPKPFRPDNTHGSIANLTNWSQPTVFHSGDEIHPKASSVGAYRLSDRESSLYSGSGPTRSAPADRGRLPGGDCSASTASPTMGAADWDEKGDLRFRRDGGPYFDAPADISPSLPGLRTDGTRNGSSARLGGTSAAAPLIARFLANQLYRTRHNVPEAGVLHNVLPQAQSSDLKSLEPSRRATLTPTHDDRFKRGQHRLTPKSRR